MAQMSTWFRRIDTYKLKIWWKQTKNKTINHQFDPASIWPGISPRALKTIWRNNKKRKVLYSETSAKTFVRFGEVSALERFGLNIFEIWFWVVSHATSGHSRPLSPYNPVFIRHDYGMDKGNRSINLCSFILKIFSYLLLSSVINLQLFGKFHQRCCWENKTLFEKLQSPLYGGQFQAKYSRGTGITEVSALETLRYESFRKNWSGKKDTVRLRKVSVFQRHRLPQKEFRRPIYAEVVLVYAQHSRSVILQERSIQRKEPGPNEIRENGNFCCSWRKTRYISNSIKYSRLTRFVNTFLYGYKFLIAIYKLLQTLSKQITLNPNPYRYMKVYFIIIRNLLSLNSHSEFDGKAVQIIFHWKQFALYI